MKSSTFEIRVALIGYVSVGKSTVLNALLGDKFSEVSLRRTTAGVNMFRVVSQKHIANKNRPSKDQRTVSPTSSEEGGAITDWSVVAKEDNEWQVRSAQSTLEEISQDNARLRTSAAMEEKSFDVVVDEPICDLRDDTQLVLIDVPGINEADSSNKYKTQDLHHRKVEHI